MLHSSDKVCMKQNKKPSYIVFYKFTFTLMRYKNYELSGIATYN